MAALLVAACVVVVGLNLTCTYASEEAVQAQEAFVRNRIPDARDVESGVSDCDDDGDGYVSFTTDLTPAAARDAFLADQSCSPYDGFEDDEFAVACTSGKSTAYVGFDVFGGGPTMVELSLP